MYACMYVCLCVGFVDFKTAFVFQRRELLSEIFDQETLLWLFSRIILSLQTSINQVIPAGESKILCLYYIYLLPGFALLIV